jgi:hypothetical protein
MKVKTIESIMLDSTEKLRNYGLIYLTGEIDPYCLRMLYDVTDQGKELLEQFFGVKNLDMQPNWNQSHGQKWSIALPHSLRKDLMLFILFHIEGCDAVIEQGNGYIGYTGEKFLLIQSEDFRNQLRWNPNSKKGTNFNRHQMSGRTQL